MICHHMARIVDSPIALRYSGRGPPARGEFAAQGAGRRRRPAQGGLVYAPPGAAAAPHAKQTRGPITGSAGGWRRALGSSGAGGESAVGARLSGKRLSGKRKGAAVSFS